MFSLLLLLLGSPPFDCDLYCGDGAHPHPSINISACNILGGDGGVDGVGRGIYNNAANKTVPPNIVDSGTTDGVVAREGSNVSLSCRATGHPEPNITWKREDGSEFIYNGVAGQLV